MVEELCLLELGENSIVKFVLNQMGGIRLRNGINPFIIRRNEDKSHYFTGKRSLLVDLL